MRFFYNVSSGQFVAAFGADYPPDFTTTKLKRRDGLLIEFVPFEGFTYDATSYAVSGLEFGIFDPGAYGSDAVAYTNTFTTEEDPADATRTIYVGRPVSDTHQLNALFHGRESAVIAASGASYTLVLTDAEDYVVLTHSSDHTCTVPPNSSVAFDVGTVIVLYNNAGAGNDLTVAAGVGVTLTLDDVTALVEPGHTIKITKTATNTWVASASDEADEVEVDFEFSWVKDSESVSTPKGTITVENDYIRADGDTPEEAASPSDYLTEVESDGRYVRFDAVQALSAGEQGQSRENINAADLDDVVTLTEQTLSDDQKLQARTNIGAMSGDVEDLEGVLLTSEQTLSSGEKIQVQTNIGVLSEDATETLLARKLGWDSEEADFDSTQRETMRRILDAAPASNLPRVTSWKATHLSTTADVDGIEAATAIGTATARPAHMYELIGTCTGNASTNLITTTVDPADFSGASLFFETTGTLPGGVSRATPYTMSGLSGSGPFTFALSEVADITSSGSGTHYVFGSTAQLFNRIPFASRSKRIGYVSSGSAGSSCGIRFTPQFTGWAALDLEHYEDWLWTFKCRFVVSDQDLCATGRTFVGLWGGTANPSNADPSSLTNCVGIVQDAGATGFSFYHAGTIAQTPSASTTGIWRNGTYDLTISKLPQDSSEDPWARITLKARAFDPGTNDYIGTTETYDVPAPTGQPPEELPQYSMLSPLIWRNNGSTASAVGIDVCYWEHHSDY